MIKLTNLLNRSPATCHMNASDLSYLRFEQWMKVRAGYRWPAVRIPAGSARDRKSTTSSTASKIIEHLYDCGTSVESVRMSMYLLLLVSHSDSFAWPLCSSPIHGFFDTSISCKYSSLSFIHHHQKSMLKSSITDVKMDQNSVSITNLPHLLFRELLATSITDYLFELFIFALPYSCMNMVKGSESAAALNACPPSPDAVVHIDLCRSIHIRVPIQSQNSPKFRKLLELIWYQATDDARWHVLMICVSLASILTPSAPFFKITMELVSCYWPV